MVQKRVDYHQIHLEKAKRARNIKLIALVAVLIIAIGAAVYIAFFQYKSCNGLACFQDNMKVCKKTVYINEEPEASWQYKISGSSNGQCAVVVKLLQAKSGELGIDKFTGEEMTCFYDSGVVAYPEKDLSKCHGLLKEDLQGIIINKLHSYIIENLGQIGKGLSAIGA